MELTKKLIPKSSSNYGYNVIVSRDKDLDTIVTEDCNTIENSLEKSICRLNQNIGSFYDNFQLFLKHKYYLDFFLHSSYLILTGKSELFNLSLKMGNLNPESFLNFKSRNQSNEDEEAYDFQFGDSQKPLSKLQILTKAYLEQGKKSVTNILKDPSKGRSLKDLDRFVRTNSKLLFRKSADLNTYLAFNSISKKTGFLLKKITKNPIARTTLFAFSPSGARLILYGNPITWIIAEAVIAIISEVIDQIFGESDDFKNFAELKDKTNFLHRGENFSHNSATKILHSTVDLMLDVLITSWEEIEGNHKEKENQLSKLIDFYTQRLFIAKNQILISKEAIDKLQFRLFSQFGNPIDNDDWEFKSIKDEVVFDEILNIGDFFLSQYDASLPDQPKQQEMLQFLANSYKLVWNRALGFHLSEEKDIESNTIGECFLQDSSLGHNTVSNLKFSGKNVERIYKHFIKLVVPDLPLSSFFRNNISFDDDLIYQVDQFVFVIQRKCPAIYYFFQTDYFRIEAWKSFEKILPTNLNHFKGFPLTIKREEGGSVIPISISGLSANTIANLLYKMMGNFHEEKKHIWYINKSNLKDMTIGIINDRQQGRYGYSLKFLQSRIKPILESNFTVQFNLNLRAKNTFEEVLDFIEFFLIRPNLQESFVSSEEDNASFPFPLDRILFSGHSLLLRN